MAICIVTLWQTALLRLSKLRVRDEINEALRYYDASLFETLPAITAELERMVADGTEPGSRRTGPDDGPGRTRAGRCRWGRGSAAIATAIPFVTAEVVRFAVHRHASVALDHHLARARTAVA